MAKLAVNPTRMELTRLKGRLKTARRGHKLLKDKRDELMKQFLEIVKQNRALRIKVEEALIRAGKSFTVASAAMSPEFLEEALLYPKQSVALEFDYKNIMSVNVPVYEFKTSNEDPSEIYPYGFATTLGELDDAVLALSEILPDLLQLAQIEKSVQLLSQEIEKTRRRVNALEYVMIPQLEETIRYIVMKLDENERGNLSRLMKVKDMMIQEARKKNAY
jgi:V/A-type H+-transporting ATPase subunit D